MSSALTNTSKFPYGKDINLVQHKIQMKSWSWIPAGSLGVINLLVSFFLGRQQQTLDALLKVSLWILFGVLLLCAINHNSFPVVIDSIQKGLIISNNQIFDVQFTTNKSKGVTVSNNNFGDIDIRLNNDTATFFNGNRWFNSKDITNNGSAVFAGNFDVNDPNPTYTIQGASTTDTSFQVIRKDSVLLLSVKDNGEPKVYILEANPRASRTVPFVSKAIGIPIAKIAAKLMIGHKLADLGLTDEIKIDHVAVKESVFPFIKLPEADSVLGPEMKSTGESMGIDDNFGVSYYKEPSMWQM